MTYLDNSSPRNPQDARIVTTSSNITIEIPRELRGYCEGASALLFPATSVRGALEEIEQKHPSLYRSICEETGRVRRHLNLFVNSTHVRELQGLDTVLNSGDVVIIIPAVSGG